MRVALYARVSTDEQEAAPQIARLRVWAERAGYVVHMERTDIATGKSGRHVNRPGQDEILAAARGHHVHVVAVAKVDRWARSVRHLSTTVDELHGLGVDFYAVDQGLAVKRGDPTAKLMLGILSSVAEWEASIISERTKDALKARKAAGVKLGRPRKGSKLSPLANGQEVGGLEKDRFIPTEGRNAAAQNLPYEMHVDSRGEEPRQNGVVTSGPEGSP